MNYHSKYQVDSTNVFDTLNKYILADGFDIVIDCERNKGAKLYDKRSGKLFYDFFTGFASMPIGWNHPKIDTDDYRCYLGKAALNKPSNSDVYTEYLATFVETFFRVAVPESYMKKAFFVSGGALAVENALKTAMDWKVRRNFRTKGLKEEKGSQIIHFREAFHGRTGYTMSLTNTDPMKVKYFPKFDWPRISNPKCMFPMTDDVTAKVIEAEKRAEEEIRKAFADNPDDIAAIIIEPIQGEGGDNHFRPEFHRKLRDLCDEFDVLLIYDEVQTGVGLTGKMWCHEHFGIEPDILCFGKKMQVCGILVGNRVLEEPDNVFAMSSRINSTWGGNIVDMVRVTRYLELIEEENMLDNVNDKAEKLMTRMKSIAEKCDKVENLRGKGLFASFDFPTSEMRNAFTKECWAKGLIILGCGGKTIRFRPPLNITDDELNTGIEIIEKVLLEK